MPRRIAFDKTEDHTKTKQRSIFYLIASYLLINKTQDVIPLFSHTHTHTEEMLSTQGLARVLMPALALCQSVTLLCPSV